MGRRPRRRSTARQPREENRLIAWAFVYGVGALFLAFLLEKYGALIAILLGVVLALLAFWQIRVILRRKKLTSELGGLLKKALAAMDDTARTYTDEEEANKELVSILKMQGHDATYQFRLSDGRIADAKVGDFLIEGKLAPALDDVDRLMGQLGAYSKHPYKVNVVVYGHLARSACKRIEDEIRERYPNKVFLTYLENPRRRRA